VPRLGINACVLGCAVALAAGNPRAQEATTPDPLAEIEALHPDDPLFGSTGSWGQAYEDQWALRRIGCVEMGAGRSAWDEQTGREAPVLVALIDSGLDYAHPELPLERLWTHPRDAIHGWSFADGDAQPWDDSGHGTYLAGIVGAQSDDAAGMAGVNPGAKLLALEVLDAEGRGSRAWLAAALDYAVGAGARVILLGFSAPGAGEPERAALRRALAAGAVVIAPAGDTGGEIPADSLAAMDGVLAVGATDRSDARAPFSSWGSALDLVAPGVDVLGLRARGSDWLARSGAPGYAARAAHVGRRHYRASTSAAAAALVAGAASLLLAERPKLAAEQVARVLRQSARDLGSPGFDPATGYGLLDARAALRADPAYYLEARIDRVEVAGGGGAPARLRVIGSADADLFQNARLEVAPAGAPERWIQAGGALNSPVRAGTLAELDPQLLDGAPRWLLRLVVRHASGAARESRFALDLGW
jgi:hypothetical protein